eukprot:241521-Amphidinium_carterae.1
MITQVCVWPLALLGQVAQVPQLRAVTCLLDCFVACAFPTNGARSRFNDSSRSRLTTPPKVPKSFALCYSPESLSQCSGPSEEGFVMITQVCVWPLALSGQVAQAPQLRAVSVTAGGALTFFRKVCGTQFAVRVSPTA